MHQICDGYNPRVRMGNWFQEGYSVPQAARDCPTKASRPAQIDIGYLDAHLKLRPLNRMARLPPWNTAGLVEAPQFSSYRARPTTKENFDLSTAGHYFQQWKPQVHEKGVSSNAHSPYVRLNHFPKEHKVFNKHNVSELLNSRPVDTASFKSGLVPSSHPSQNTLLQTTYQKQIAQQAPQTKGNSTMSGSSASSEPNFRRIRSQITLKNLPPFQTYK